MMSHPVYSLQAKTTVKSIYGGLSTLQVNGYPIVDVNDRLIGLISRDALIVLIKKQCWTEFDPNSSLTESEIIS
jgi:predicted transcriptional regulator